MKQHMLSADFIQRNGGIYSVCLCPCESCRRDPVSPVATKPDLATDLLLCCCLGSLQYPFPLQAMSRRVGRLAETTISFAVSRSDIELH